MGLSRIEVNLLRLLESDPRQKNQAKLVHYVYVTTSRELLDQLGPEPTSEGISSVSKEKLNDYLGMIKELAARLRPEVLDDAKAATDIIEEEHSPKAEYVGSPIALSSRLRRRYISQVEAEQTVSEKEIDLGAPIRLDAAAQAHIEKHRILQEDFTDGIVELARQLKESSLMMNWPVQATEKSYNFILLCHLFVSPHKLGRHAKHSTFINFPGWQGHDEF